jgi:hypothetical protein
MKLLISTVCALALLTACQSLHPFPQDDNSSTRWLEITGGEFWSTGRTVVTDNEFISEYYERIDQGRREGEHALKEQKRIVLLAPEAEAFWRHVDSLMLLSWSDADMPQRTDHPSLVYRKDNRSVALHSPASAQSGGERFEALQEKIGELGKLSIGALAE